MNNVFDAYWKEVEDSVSGCTVELVLKITCEGLSPCIRRSVRKAPTEFSMTTYTFTLYIGLPVLRAAAVSRSHQLYYNNSIYTTSLITITQNSAKTIKWLVCSHKIDARGTCKHTSIANSL